MPRPQYILYRTNLWKMLLFASDTNTPPDQLKNNIFPWAYRSSFVRWLAKLKQSVSPEFKRLYLLWIRRRRQRRRRRDPSCVLPECENGGTGACWNWKWLSETETSLTSCGIMAKLLGILGEIEDMLYESVCRKFRAQTFKLTNCLGWSLEFLVTFTTTARSRMLGVFH